MTAPLRAAGYVRVSTAKQAAEGLSLPEQEGAIRDRAKAEGWELGELYVDAGISGKKTERPELTAMLDSLDSLDRIIVTSLDRLGRNAAGMLELFDRLRRADVELVAIRQNIDTSTAMGRLIPNLMAVLAQWEAEQLGERVAATAAERAASGRHHGRAPYGYIPKDGELLPDPIRAPIVRRIFELADAGTSQRSIARILNQEKIKPQRAKQWTQGGIGVLLRNPTFKGFLNFNSDVIPGVHEPLVSAELWDRVETLRLAGTRSRKGGPGRTPAGRHLFTRGLLRCAHCGSAMQPRTYKSEGREEYRCAGRSDFGIDYCPQTPIPRDQIDLAALDYFREVGLDLDAMRNELDAAMQSKRELVDSRLRECAAEESKAVDRLARIRRDYQDERLDAEDWKSMSAELNAELKAARAELKQAQERDAELSEAETRADDPESDALKRLESIRQSVAGKLAEADDAGIAAVRAALTDMFDVFYVRAAKAAAAPLDTADALPGELDAAERVKLAARDALRDAGSEPIDAADWRLVPVPRAELLTGLDDAFRPVLRRRGLGVPDKEQVGFTT